MSHTGRELTDQAAGQQKRLASGLTAVGDDLSRMADTDDGGGFAGDLVRRAAAHVSSVGSWLGDRDPQQVLHDVTTFARRRPGTFIAAAAIAGVVVGRLSRALAAGASTGSPVSSPGTAGPRFADADARARAHESTVVRAGANDTAAGLAGTAGAASTVGGPDLDDTGLVAFTAAAAIRPRPTPPPR